MSSIEPLKEWDYVDTLVDIHDWIRWIVLLGLVSGVGLGISRHSKAEPWQPGYFRATVAAFDIQILIGIILYFGNEGWDQGIFIAVFHPIFMFAALGVSHSGIVYARRKADEEPNKVMGYAFFVALALVIAGVPWQRL